MSDHMDAGGVGEDARESELRPIREERDDLRPREPIAKRLNRNALTVAAVLMGITVLTVIVMFQPSRSATAPAATSAEAPTPSQPTFLDRPLPRPLVPVDTSTLTPPPLGDLRRSSSAIPSSNDGRSGLAYNNSPSTGGYAVSPDSVEAESRARALAMAREQAFHSALSSGVLVGGARSDERRVVSNGEVMSADSTGNVLPRPMQSVPQAAPQQFTPSASPPSPLATAAPPATPSHSIAAHLERPVSPYVLSGGTIVPGVLITGIVSDLPGDVIAQVSRDVYDSRTERLLLIPKGSKLVGTYDNRIVASQSRLLIAWTRLILPDGRSLTLPGLPLKDLSGQTGVKDKVDTHSSHVFGSAALLSVIGAAVQLSQPQQSSVLTPPSTGQVLAGSAGQELAQVATEILRRGMDQPPTITIRPATPFNVFLNGDLVFDAPYVAMPLTAMR